MHHGTYAVNQTGLTWQTDLVSTMEPRGGTGVGSGGGGPRIKRRRTTEEEEEDQEGGSRIRI